MEVQDIDLRALIEKETGERFNKIGHINCPFHNEKNASLSVKFLNTSGKYMFKCFGCNISGDAIGFIMKLKNVNYVEARKYLGLSIKNDISQENIIKIKKYINCQISKLKEHKKLIEIFTFKNINEEDVYYKAKFIDAEGSKTFSYYHLENGNVINKRGADEIAYNLNKVIKGINRGAVIVICEGEKDANTINAIFKNDEYIATSIKGCKDVSILQESKIYVLSDTGTAGEEYKLEIKRKLFPTAKEFKFINLKGIEELGDNKDVTDWLEAGHTKKDLINAFDRSLDLKSEYELQQTEKGIYKIEYKEKKKKSTIRYLTNFKILNAIRIKFDDKQEEGIKLFFKSSTGEELERIGPSTVFDDVKTFKNFLGSMDIAFKGTINDLTDLKLWINKYFALDIQEIHEGIKFIERNGDLLFITKDGAISKNKIIKSIKTNESNIDVIGVPGISVEELKEAKNHILNFATLDKTLSLVGTIINNLLVYQSEKLKHKLHLLLIVGESGSGKSTILENVISPILNYPKKDIQSIGLITPFALVKNLSQGNYTTLFDEFKPSSLDKFKIAKISEMLRNLYDRSTVSRGNKSLKSINFQLKRPVIIAGEESYPNNEKALIERSCIVYLSKKERAEEHTKAMKWIIENKKILNKLGKSLIDIVLNLSIDEYEKIRKLYINSIEVLKNRPLNTAVNICCGIEIFNILLRKNNIEPITNYIDYIVKNIKTEILQDRFETASIIENMLILYNQMIEDGRAINVDNFVKYQNNKVFIKTSEMLSQMNEYVKKVGADIIPLALKDFKKQALKSGYLLENSNKSFKVNGKAVRFDTYDVELLRKLNLNAIVPPEIENVTDEEDKFFPFN